jgi:hypothetical protein
MNIPNSKVRLTVELYVGFGTAAVNQRTMENLLTCLFIVRCL